MFPNELLQKLLNMIRPNYSIDVNVQGTSLEIAQGNVEGVTFVNKFGENPAVPTGGADIWDFGGAYTFSTTADIDTVSSSSGSDTQDVVVHGLDANWAESEQTITLTGQTKVTLNPPLIRVSRMYNDNGTDLAGVVYCYVDGDITAGEPDTDADVRAIINGVAGHNQTLMCIYTVPAGKTAYFTQGYIAIAEKKEAYATMEWKVRLFGKVFRTQSVVSLNSAGAGTFTYRYTIPGGLPEKSDIVISCVDASTTVALSGGFDITLIDN